MNLSFYRSTGLLLAGMLLGSLITAMWKADRIEDPDRSAGPGTRRPVKGVPSASMTDQGGNEGLPSSMNGSTRNMLGDLPALAKAEGGKPNRQLIARLKAVLQQSDESRRKLQFQLLLELMRPEDAPLVVQTFSELKQQGLIYSEEELNFFAQRWGELDPAAALRHYGAGPEVTNDRLLLERVFSGWGSHDPAQASHWALQQPEPLQSEAVLGTTLGWARKDPAAATAFVLTLPDGPARAQAGEIIFWQVLYSKGMNAATTWYDQLPADSAQSIRARVLPGIAGRQQLRDEDEGAKEWLKEHGP